MSGRPVFIAREFICGYVPTISLDRSPFRIQAASVDWLDAHVRRFLNGVSWKRVSLLALVLGVVLSACSDPAFLPECPTTVEIEPTGDVSIDIVGAWFASGPFDEWDHPLATFDDTGGLDKVWMFRTDGTGHMWWVLNDAGGGSEEGDREFEWQVVDGQLGVDDLPPAELSFTSPSRVLIHPIDASRDAAQGIGWTRCELEVPEGIRGF